MRLGTGDASVGMAAVTGKVSQRNRGGAAQNVVEMYYSLHVLLAQLCSSIWEPDIIKASPRPVVPINVVLFLAEVLCVQ